MDWNNDVQFLAKILLAVVLAGLVGFERELARKPAGLRTHMLVGASATLLVGLGNIIVARFEAPANVTTDPIRLIEAVIVGVSFLGTGTILQREKQERVEGLTTAASLLFAAGIGIGVALDQYVLTIGVTLMILVITGGLRYLDDWLHRRTAS